jgi:hypothetical protein
MISIYIQAISTTPIKPKILCLILLELSHVGSDTIIDAIEEFKRVRHHLLLALSLFIMYNNIN